MTDQKDNDNKESQCPFYNPQAPSQSKVTPLPKQSGRTWHIVLWCLLLAVVLYFGYNYFSHRNPAAETIPDSGKNSTLVTPTTATNAGENNQLPSNTSASSAS